MILAPRLRLGAPTLVELYTTETLLALAAVVVALVIPTPERGVQPPPQGL